MELLYKNEHLNCFNYDMTAMPLIEVLQYPLLSENSLFANNNEVAFILEGKICFEFPDRSEVEANKGQILFIAAGNNHSFTVERNCTVMVFRIHDPIRICEGFPLERLHKAGRMSGMDISEMPVRNYSLLQFNPRMWHFASNLNDILNDGIRCRHYFDLKIKEFFVMLRTYYPKEELHDFLYHILSGDVAFSEHVRQNWQQYRTVNELADSMHLSPKHFSRKFKGVFGETPYQWILHGRSKTLHTELTASDKPFKQIAIEYGFSTMAQFTKFCKKELGKTPSDIRFPKELGEG